MPVEAPAAPTAPTVSVSAPAAQTAEPEKASREPDMSPLLSQLKGASDTKRAELLIELASRFGGAGLARALSVVPKSPPETAFAQTQQIMRALRDLRDPRASDVLFDWVEKANPGMHWSGEAGLRLAEVGDIRGAGLLGKRMSAAPESVYSQDRPWEKDDRGHLAQTDLPRIVSARMLSDLVMLYPEKKEALSAHADSVLLWQQDRPHPHANGMRFLALTGTSQGIGELRKWAFPSEAMPAPGASPPFPVAYEIAQSALRYIGLAKDEPSFQKLLGQLSRKKDKRLDITLEGLSNGPNAMFGMALRAVGFGASQGLEHWADSRAKAALVRFIEDETWHEEARLAACEALAWSGGDPPFLVAKVKEYTAKKDAKKQLVGECYGRALARYPSATVAFDLADFIAPTQPRYLRLIGARALSKLALDSATEAKLIAKLTEKKTRAFAALALLLGGSKPVVDVLDVIAKLDPDELVQLKDDFLTAVSDVAIDDPSEERLLRWVGRAMEAAGIQVGGGLQTWPRERLVMQLESNEHDAGPHTRSSTVLRVRLYRIAKGADRKAAASAVTTLALMMERGMLAALAAEQGETAALAAKALEELPKLSVW